MCGIKGSLLSNGGIRRVFNSSNNWQSYVNTKFLYIHTKVYWDNILRSEVAKIKGDICATLGTCIQAVCTTFRDELATAKNCLQTSITALEIT